MDKILYIGKRLVEPSTHAALSAVFLSLGMKFPEADWKSWTDLASIIFGMAGVFVKEYHPDNSAS